METPGALLKIPTVSVIIPVLNSISTIKTAIQSVENQTYGILEIIVVDNGSTDGTLEYLTTFDNRIRVLKCYERGAGPARNFGVAEASGDLIAFLDSDDIWHTQKIEHQIKKHFQEGLAGIVSGGFSRFIGGSGRVVGTSILCKSDDEVERILNTGQMPAVLSSWVMSKETFIKLGGFNPEYVFAQDLDFILRAYSHGIRIRVLSEMICDYRLFSGSETNQSYVKQYLTAIYLQMRELGNGEDSTLNEFIIQEAKFRKRNFRKANAGKHFRHFLVAYTTPQYFKAFVHLSLSIILDSRSVWRKFRRQSQFSNRKFL